ncbi:hypothetical protein AM414_000544 [Acinetobacter baumannii]|nr:hypothetical protein AM414_000544 [Acinetobacter baumannii]
MVKQKNIIIGSATGYNADLISSFVYSLGKTDFDGILTLIIYKEQMTEFVNAFSDVKNFKIEFKVSTIGKFLCTRQISQNPYPIRVLPS